jgi:hypothetical protein
MITAKKDRVSTPIELLDSDVESSSAPFQFAQESMSFADQFADESHRCSS